MAVRVRRDLEEPTAGTLAGREANPGLRQPTSSQRVEIEDRSPLQGWVDGPPVIEHLTVVGSYHLVGPQREESAAR